MRNKSFSQGSAVQRRKPQEPPPPGLGAYTQLTFEEKSSLVEYCRKTVQERRVLDRADDEEHMAYRKAKVKTNSQTQLEVRPAARASHGSHRPVLVVVRQAICNEYLVPCRRRSSPSSGSASPSLSAGRSAACGQGWS